MTSEKAKKGLWIASILSVVIGAVLAICTYGSLLDLRSINLIGLIYILIIGLFALICAVRARLARTSS